MSKAEAEAEDTPGVNRRAQRSRVAHAVSRPQFRLSHEATGPCIARIVTAPEEKIAAGVEGIGKDGRARSGMS
jgi:hypothetical protein